MVTFRTMGSGSLREIDPKLICAGSTSADSRISPTQVSVIVGWSGSFV
jgi:hypothetical protein